MERKKIDFTVRHVGRVEGHAGVKVEFDSKGKVDVEMNVFEGIRFYEAIVKGKNINDVPSIVSRVCGICSADHNICSLMAIESAFGVKPDEMTGTLREILLNGALIESHSLHLFFLVLPDLYDKNSIIEVRNIDRRLMEDAMFIKDAGNLIQEIIGGRVINPINTAIGRFHNIPSVEQFDRLEAKLAEALDRLLEIKDKFFGSHKPLDMDFPGTVYISAVKEGGGYLEIPDNLKVSTGEFHELKDFRKVVSSRVVAYSNAKEQLYSDSPFMTGALSRLKLYGGSLKYKNAEAARNEFPMEDLTDPLFNNIAQFIEIIYAIEDSLERIKMIKGIISDYRLGPPKGEEVFKKAGKMGDNIPVRERSGLAAIEVPRGVLYHYYEVGKDGTIQNCEIVTPTAQNLANLEKDIKFFIKQNLDKLNKDGIIKNVEKIIRSYDLCISCSVH